MMASEVLILDKSPCLAAPNHGPVLSFAFCDAVLTGVVIIPKLFGFVPCFLAASILTLILTLSGIAGTGGGGSSEKYGLLGIPPVLSDLCDSELGDGDGDRNVLSVIDPELDCLLR